MGHNHWVDQQVNSDFSKARLRSWLHSISATLQQEPQTLLPFEEVRSRILIRGQHDRGIQIVPLNAIIGSEGRYADFDVRLIGWLNEVKAKSRTGVSAPGELVDLNYILHEMRLVKRVEELRLMRRAARVSAAGHRRAMGACRPGMKEYQIEAELEYEFRRGGAHSPAYPSIVASGANACTLHYIDNGAELGDGELLLIDAGAEIDCYAADVTRTFPVNGRFSAAQRDLYELVLQAQQAGIAEARPGVPVTAPHRRVVSVLSEGLVELGLLPGPADEVVAKGWYRQFFFHGTSHWLGIDVHDAGDSRVGGAGRPLAAGMAFTVEPGPFVSSLISQQPSGLGHVPSWFGD